MSIVPFVEDPAPPLPEGSKPAPIRDAATLMLVRKSAGAWTVLMGQRAAGHAFMPQKWVFPGGRVDRGDSRAGAASELAPDIEGVIAAAKRRPPRAYALAAVRETFEETGLIVGKHGAPPRRAPKPWRDYAAHAVAPELGRFRYVGRAITPPGRPRRFDAHFFLALADDVLLDDRPHAESDELWATRWLPFEEALAYDLPAVTRFMLREAFDQLEGRAAPGRPFLRRVGKSHRLDRV